MRKNNGKLILLTALMFLAFSVPQLRAAQSISVPTDSQGRPLLVDGQVVVRFDASIPDSEQESLAQATGYKILLRAHWSHVIVLLPDCPSFT